MTNPNLSPRQFEAHEFADSWDPEDADVHPGAKFEYVPHYDLSKLRASGVIGRSGAWHDKQSNINDGYYREMQDMVENGQAGELSVTEHASGPPDLHDGWHRASIAMQRKVTHLPAYVHRDTGCCETS